MDTNLVGHRNRVAGWALFLIGVMGGMVMGAWTFDGPVASPERFADYSSLPRRLLRLAHIATLALGMTNVLYAREIDTVCLSSAIRRLGSNAMIAAGVLMPVVLTAAAFDTRFKWGLPAPALATAYAVTVLLFGLSRQEAS